MFNKRRRLYKRKKLLLFVTLSLVLFLGIGYSVVKDNILVSSGATFSPVPTLKATTSSDTSAFRSSTYKTKIKTITFEDKIDIPATAVEGWDIGVNQNGDVMAFVTLNSKDSNYYDLYIQSNEQLYANKDMSYWFANLTAVDSINNLYILNTNYVTNMSNMFQETGFNSTIFTLDLGDNFDTSNVTNMSYMFQNIGGYSTIFTLDLGEKFNTNKVTNMEYMFYKVGISNKTFTLDLGDNFDTSNVENMSYMFYNTGYNSTSFTLDVSNFNTSNVTDMSHMFQATGYKNPNFTLDVSNFNTRNVTNMNSMFTDTGCESTIFTLDVSSFDTSNVTDMSSMFAYTGYHNPTFTLDVSNFNTSKVTNMSYMFRSTGYSSTVFSLDLKNFDTRKVTNMSYMFRATGHSSTVFTLDLSNFNTSNVTNMSYMFRGTGYQSPVFALNLSNFNTSKVKTMNDMFYSCGFNSLSFTLDLSSFDTRNVTNMSNMFREAGYQSSVFTLDLSNFNTSKVTDMSYMFRSTGENSPIFNLNLSNFDTSNVTNMEYMFYSMANTSTELNFTFTIKNPNTTTYTDMFKEVATNSGTKITVNYTTETSDLVDQMIVTKSSDSNVVKGYNVEKLITFTIDGVSYTANEGMTWNHWIDSEYNIENFIEQGQVYTKNYTDYIVDEDWSGVYANDLITPGAAYYLEVFCCFDAGSKVLMADGTTKNIEDVEIGDLVMSLNEDTGQFVKQKVTSTIINKKSTDLVYVNLSDGTRIGMRAYHPLLTTEGWKSLRPNSPDAIRENIEGLTLLEVGDTLVGYDKNVTIISIEQRPEVENYYTYNLSVEGHHNYIVNGIIAHNSGCDQGV